MREEWFSIGLFFMVVFGSSCAFELLSNTSNACPKTFTAQRAVNIMYYYYEIFNVKLHVCCEFDENDQCNETCSKQQTRRASKFKRVLVTMKELKYFCCTGYQRTGDECVKDTRYELSGLVKRDYVLLITCALLGILLIILLLIWKAYKIKVIWFHEKNDQQRAAEEYKRPPAKTKTTTKVEKKQPKNSPAVEKSSMEMMTRTTVSIGADRMITHAPPPSAVSPS